MQDRITQIVTDSFGQQFYGKAMDCLKVLRQECIKVGVAVTEVQITVSHPLVCVKQLSLKCVSLEASLKVCQTVTEVCVSLECLP